MSFASTGLGLIVFSRRMIADRRWRLHVDDRARVRLRRSSLAAPNSVDPVSGELAADLPSDQDPLQAPVSHTHSLWLICPSNEPVPVDVAVAKSIV
jgi:hypothetical protein